MRDNDNDNFVIDLIESQKNEKKFYQKIIILLIILMFIQSIYHNYKWSQFDTVVVDSSDGGNAGYIGNDGDVNNYGKGSSPQEEAEQREQETKTN